MKLTQPLIVYLPDTCGVEISRYGKGNLKIGPDVYTYSRPAGLFETCPGASAECEAICYAKRIREPILGIYFRNIGDDVPPIPGDCRLLRLHISGDFDTPEYTRNWRQQLLERSDVRCWAYTRSWRVPYLLPPLEELRALPNVQMFASMDSSIQERPPAGWRIAWIDGDPRADDLALNKRPRIRLTAFDTISYTCPEQTGHKHDCQECRYCFDGRRGDVTFLRH